MRLFIKFVFFSLLFNLIVTPVNAAASVFGDWITSDEPSQKPGAIIQIYKGKNAVEGRIARIFSPQKQKDICKNCKGLDKNKPMLGLVIIKDMQCDNGFCKGGNITDPRNGKIYHATMNVGDNNKNLKVRGYIGIPLFGRSVTWYRQLK